MPTDEPAAPADGAASVVDQILGNFLTKVEADDGLKGVGARLRMALLAGHVGGSEADLKTAMFGGTGE